MAFACSVCQVSFSFEQLFLPLGFNFSFRFTLFCVCVSALPTCMCVYHVSGWCLWMSQEGSDPGLDLEMVVSDPGCAQEQQVLLT